MDAIDHSAVQTAVREAIGDPAAELLDWCHDPIQVGSVGELFRLSGEVRSHSGAETPWSLVLKIQRQWERGGDPESWKREALVYRSGLFDELPETLVVPRCCSLHEHNDEIWYWFEQASGTTADEFRLEHYCQAARHLAHFQGLYLAGRPLPSYPWLSTRRWLGNTVSGWGTGAVSWLDTSDSSSLSNSIREQVLRLWAERDDFLDAIDSLTRTVCHRDYNPENLFLPPANQATGRTIVIDWDCVGIGSVAEDIGDLVGEAFVFQGFDTSRATDLKESILAAYVEGLDQSGCKLNAELVELGFATISPLQWCFRLICRFRDTEDTSVRGRYLQILEFMLEQGQVARQLASQLRPDV